MAPLAETALEKKVRHLIRTAVEFLPCDLAAVVLGHKRLDQLVLVPGHLALLLLGGIQLDERGLAAV